jgi:hypothetical protein
MAKLKNDQVICDECGSHAIVLGHGGYKQGYNGFGDKEVVVAYQCSNKTCQRVWRE